MLTCVCLLTCVSLFVSVLWHTVPALHSCEHQGVLGSPRESLQGERKCPCAPGLPSSDHLGWRCSLLCVLFWHVTDHFCMLSEIPEGKTTAYFSASWRKGRSIFSETLLLREFGTSAEAVLGPFPLSFNKWEYLSWWSVISSAGSAQRSSPGQLKW